MDFGPRAGELGEHVQGSDLLVAYVGGRLGAQQGAIKPGRGVGEIGRMGHDALPAFSGLERTES